VSEVSNIDGTNRTPKKIFLKNQNGYQKTQNFMLISDLLKLSQKKPGEKSYEQNSQLKVPFLAFTHT